MNDVKKLILLGELFVKAMASNAEIKAMEMDGRYDPSNFWDVAAELNGISQEIHKLLGENNDKQ